MLISRNQSDAKDERKPTSLDIRSSAQTVPEPGEYRSHLFSEERDAGSNGYQKRGHYLRHQAYCVGVNIGVSRSRDENKAHTTYH
jgi:hypothetical protein